MLKISLSDRQVNIIRILIVVGVVVTAIVMYSNYVGGSIVLKNDLVAQIDVQRIADNYEVLLSDAYRGRDCTDDLFVDSISQFGYKTDLPHVCIGVYDHPDGVIGIRVFEKSRNLYDDAQFEYKGIYTRWNVMRSLFDREGPPCTSHLVLESNYVSIGISMRGNGDPVAKIEEAVQLLVDAVA
ncbi:hypothetical protein LJC33_08510 [Eubacteriales bacterium OttesenSCG-928-N13]|nr:hypothetical protein [Eubacteriales bacterium OttesenSCG-928-N13]